MDKDSKVPALYLRFLDHDIGWVPINQGTFLIGRDLAANLRILDQTISREHAKIFVDEDGSLRLTDLSSTNGSKIDGRPVSSALLREGTLIHLGRIELILSLIDRFDVPETDSSFWRNVVRRRTRSFSGPFGGIILPKDDLIYEFDPQVFEMTRDSEEKKPSEERLGLRRIPRLKLIQRGSSQRDEEVTRLILAEKLKAERPESKDSGLPEFKQEPIRSWKIPIPFLAFEKLVLPVSLVIMFTLAIGLLLKVQTEKQVGSLSDFIEKNSAHVQKEIASHREMLPPEIAFTPLESQDSLSFWEHVDQNPLLRYLALFLFLDEMIESESFQWSLEESLSRLQKEASLQARLPSLKSIEWTTEIFEWPLDWDFLRESNLTLFSEGGLRKTSKTPRQTDSDFRKKVSSRLLILEECVRYRNQKLQGKAVLGFTITSDGKATAIFVDGKQRKESPAFWNCIRDQIKAQTWPKPENGQTTALIYSLNFAGPQKITF